MLKTWRNREIINNRDSKSNKEKPRKLAIMNKDLQWSEIK